MNWIKFRYISFLVLIFINFIILFATYFIQLNSLAVLVSSVIIITLITPLIINIISQRLVTLSVNFGLLLAFITIMEGLFFFRIIDHPAIRTWSMTSSNVSSVEFLEKSPFVKFKPKVTVKSQKERGDDFTYNWKTDELGFKNDLSVDILNTKFQFIALGDSFTEGMGVSTNDTWTATVGQYSDIKIYNAGVQGYSASQMKATYENLRNKINHEGIIIGLLPTIYERERRFLDYATAQYGAGGIRSIAESSKFYNSFLIGFMRAVKNLFKNEDFLLTNDQDKFNRYRNEINNNLPLQNTLKIDENWKLYVQSITKLIDIAIQDNKRVVLIQFPFRHEIYFDETQLGVKTFSEIDYYVELDLIRNTLPQNIEVLDMFPYIKRKWKDDKTLIYFKKDGHMNEAGHNIIAEFIIETISMTKN